MAEPLHEEIISGQMWCHPSRKPVGDWIRCSACACVIDKPDKRKSLNKLLNWKKLRWKPPLSNNQHLSLLVDQQIIFGPNNRSTGSVDRIPRELGLTFNTEPYRIVVEIVKDGGPVGLVTVLHHWWSVEELLLHYLLLVTKDRVTAFNNSILDQYISRFIYQR